MDRDINAILSHVSVAGQKKEERLGDILNDWANYDVQRAFWLYPDKVVAKEQLKIIGRVIRHAEGLRDAFKDFEEYGGVGWLVPKLIELDDNFRDRQEEQRQESKLAKQKSFLQELELAAKAIERGFAVALAGC